MALVFSSISPFRHFVISLFRHFAISPFRVLNTPTAGRLSLQLEIVITRAAPAFHKLFMVMGCVFDINTVHKTVAKLTFQAFY